MIILKAAVAALFVVAVASPALSASLESEMLAAHNALRAKHGAPPLSWSASLAQTAQAWANACIFQHSQTNYGENLAEGTGYSASQAVNDWYGEISQYDFNNPGYSDATGHFTQVVWKGTTKVGCGSADCGSDGTFYVCNYDPAGNLEGAFPDNVSAAN